MCKEAIESGVAKEVADKLALEPWTLSSPGTRFSGV
jgi:hypothetical protein